jgi:cadmium resistance protein CadD (predicted permease)
LATTAIVLQSVSLAVVLFASTDLDDIFVLVGLFADRKYSVGSIVVGQYLGIFFLVGVSAVAALMALIIPREYVGLLGIAPMLIGAKKLIDLWSHEEEQDLIVEMRPTRPHTEVLSVGLITVANGGDNLSVYIPAFAVRSAAEIAIIAVIFAAMTTIWLLLAHWMVNHRMLRKPLQRYGTVLAPLVLIALGCSILYEANSFALITSFL